MKNFYKEQIEKVAMEKIAARAWKKVFPRLSDANYKRLVDAGIYNKDKELKGLRRGTHNILGKNNTKLVRNPNRAGAFQAEARRDYLKSVGAEPDADLIARSKAEPRNSMSAYTLTRAGIPGKDNINLNKPAKSVKGATGMTFIPKNEHNRMFQNNPDLKGAYPNVEPISRRDRDNKKWTQAITERHEADEVRYHNNFAKKGLLDTVNKKPYYSHISPKVLAQESANVGMMPREIKNNNYKGMRKVTGEDKNISELTGVPYGSSGVYNKKAARKAEKTYLKSPTPYGFE